VAKLFGNQEPTKNLQRTIVVQHSHTHTIGTQL